MNEPTIIEERAVDLTAELPMGGTQRDSEVSTTLLGDEQSVSVAAARGGKKPRAKAVKGDGVDASSSSDANPEDGQVGPAEEIPDKLYFRIGEVARLAGIKPYVLRFWESEFSSLGPKKSGTGHRLYRRKDVQLVLEIKTLLYEKRFTIEGARKHLETRGKIEPMAAANARAAKGAAKKLPKAQVSLFDVPVSALDSVRKELTEILKMLKA